MTHTMVATDPGAEGWWSEFDAAPEPAAACPGSDHPHAKVVVIRDGGSYAITVVPRTAQLDLAKLERLTRGCGLALASEGTVPPVGRLFGLPVYLDRALAAEAEMVYMRIERPGIASLA